MFKNYKIVSYESKSYYFIQNFQLIFGCFMVALGFNFFLGPSQIAAGGVVGISVLIKHLLDVEPALTQMVINAPLFFLGFYIFGREYGLKSIVGTFLVPVFIFFTRDLPQITKDPLLACIYGGLLIGVGLGLVFRSEGSTGGTSVIASLINKYFGVTIGNSQALIDGFIILGGALSLGIEKALYALISLVITGKVIDLVQMGFTSSKVAYVLSKEVDVVSNAIINDLDRGLTRLEGFGGYTNEERPVLMVVMDQNQINKFKHIVEMIDPDAFVIISDAYEVLGEGFNLNRK